MTFRTFLALTAFVSVTPVPAQVREPVTRAPQTGRPATPADVRAVKTAPDAVTVTWQEVPGATEYAIGRLVPPAGWTRVARVPGGTTHYIDTGRDFRASHQYNVVAIAGAMASLPGRSNEVLPGDPVLSAGVVDTKMTPPADTAGKGAVSSPVLSTAGCSTNGGYAICVGSTATLGVAESRRTTTAYCPTGQFAVGGGYSSSSHLAFASESRPSAVGEKTDRPGWIVTMQRIVPNASTDAATIVSSMFGSLTPVDFLAYVVCANPR